MSKAATVCSDQHILPMNGRWIWKDEGNTLEYISNHPNADKQAGKKDKKGKGMGGLLLHDPLKKLNERGGTPNPALARRTPGLKNQRNSKQTGAKSPTQKKKEAEQHKFVTLDDIKEVSYGMLEEQEEISQWFETLFGTEQFDYFLAHLLYYFSVFFEKQAHEQKPNPMNIEPSAADKTYYSELCVKHSAAQKHLGTAYSILVLGIGLEDHHHMGGGISRVSNTYKDRSMYETLYSFCVYVVWIGFRRKDYAEVRKELGRMLRSDTFNPSLRIKNAPEAETETLEEDKRELDPKEKLKNRPKSISPAEYRRLQGKRPAIKSIINQRSPALVSILPSPKEEAHWLFKTQRPLSPTTLGTIGKKDPTEESNEETMEPHPISLRNLRVGIVGEPMSQFNPITLTPQGEEVEDPEAEADKTSEERKNSIMPPTPHSKGSSAHETNVRQVTAVSTATVEALPDDE